MRRVKRVFMAKKKSQEQVEKEFLDRGYILKSEYLGALSPVDVESLVCGHTFTVSRANDVSSGRNILCKVCSPSRRGVPKDKVVEEIESFGVKVLSEYKNFKTNIEVKYNECGHVYTINPGHFLYENIGKTCQLCRGLGSVKFRFLSKLLENEHTLLDEYETTQVDVKIRANCGHEYTVIPNNYVSAGTGVKCRTCEPVSSVSGAEQDLVEYIKSVYTGWIETNDRTLISPKELDIVLPDLGIAIEYNGSYWHREEVRDKDYHINKTRLVQNEGFRLIQITDTEWLTKQDIVKSRILSILNKTTKIYARKCTLEEISFPAMFLANNHIQGSGSITPINIGLKNGGELVAVMTFSKSRFRNDCEYELVRYCSKLNTTVVGGASKLLNAFISKYTPKGLVSYSDKRWSMGNLYTKLGFEFSHTSNPNYVYHKGTSSTLSRYQCQKHLLKTQFPEHYSGNLTELEIMEKAGYFRVFDCGSDVWILK